MFSSGNNSGFHGVGYFGSDRSRGNFSTFYRIHVFLLVVLALLEHVLDENYSKDSSDADVHRVRLGIDKEPELEVFKSFEFMDYCIEHVHEFFTI